MAAVGRDSRRDNGPGRDDGDDGPDDSGDRDRRQAALAEYDAKRNATRRGPEDYRGAGRFSGDGWHGRGQHSRGHGDSRAGSWGGEHRGYDDRRREGQHRREYDEVNRAYGRRPSRWEDGAARDRPPAYNSRRWNENGGRGGLAPRRDRGDGVNTLLNPEEEQEIRDAMSSGDGGFAEYRRLVREKLREKSARCIWATSPSPESSPRREDDQEREELPPTVSRGEQGNIIDDGKAVPSLDVLKKRARVSEDEDRREAELLKKFVVMRREQQEQIRRQKLAASDGGGVPPVCPPCGSRGQGADAATPAGAVGLEEGEDGADDDVEDDGGMVGPPKPEMSTAKVAESADYGFALMPGEGEAMASYVKEGKRIPRRGEVGLTSDQIEKYESLGFVMSGSRHNRMNAIRIRKENQVYSAEEKAALAMINHEEKEKREAKVMADLKRLVENSLVQPE